MTPSEREFGELLGEVRGLREQIGTEHAAVMGRLGRLEEKIDGKASEVWVKEHEERIDSLEGTRERGEGAAHLIKTMQGFVLFGLALGGFLLTRGVLG